MTDQDVAAAEPVVVQAGDAPVLVPTDTPPPEHGTASGAAIVQYFDAAAEHLETVRDEIKTMMDSIINELTITATNAREIGQLEAKRIVESTVRMQSALKAIQDVRATFSG